MILLAPYGSRGDVQPVAAIGRELASRGHDVVLCAPPDLAPVAAAAELRFIPVGPPQSHLFDGSQSNASTFRAALNTARQQFDALAPLARDASVIVGSALQFAAPTIAATHGIPYVYVMLSPVYLRSAELSPIGAPRGRVTQALHRVLLTVEDARHMRHAAWLRSLRRAYQQPPIRNLEQYLTRSGTILLVSDPVLAPLRREDSGVVHTGHVYLDAPAALPDVVEHFLRAGSPPVFVGFGSMRHRGAARLANALLDGVRLARRRAIVHESVVSLASESALAPDVFVTGDLPHSALLPRISACVHHGGYGTTIEAARAGTPQVIMPHLGDQFHHARRAAELGIAATPISLNKNVSASQVARALEFALEPATVAAAREFGTALLSREGTARAANEVERLMARSFVQI
jgi:vancomycin aglycone glucosyltransferase